MWFSRWRLAISIAALLLIFGFVGVVESGTVVIDEILPYCIDETGAKRRDDEWLSWKTGKKRDFLLSNPIETSSPNFESVSFSEEEYGELGYASTASAGAYKVGLAREVSVAFSESGIAKVECPETTSSMRLKMAGPLTGSQTFWVMSDLNDGNEEVLGPFSGDYLNSKGGFIRSVPGYKATVHVEDESGISEVGDLKVASVSCRFPDPKIVERVAEVKRRGLRREWEEIRGDNKAILSKRDFCDWNEACTVNANCFEDSDFPFDRVISEGAIAQMLYERTTGSYICTGSLIGDALRTADSRLFITANHCLNTDAEADSLELHFNYSVECGADCYPTEGDIYKPFNDPYALYVAGADLLATGTYADYTLMELDDIPEYRCYYGWTSDEDYAEHYNEVVYRFSHPKGSPRIFSNQSILYNVDFYCSSLPRPRFIYSEQITTVEGDSTMDGGSSGSGLFNVDNQLVGTLYGTCGYRNADLCDFSQYNLIDGSFYYAYEADVEDVLNPTPSPIVPCGPVKVWELDFNTYPDGSSVPNGLISGLPSAWGTSSYGNLYISTANEETATDYCYGRYYDWRICHPPQIFDSAVPTYDRDLGTPNQQFGGPGKGSGGSAPPGENRYAKGNLIIISEHNNVNQPDDEANGGDVWFRWGIDVPLAYVEIIDIDLNEVDGYLEIYDEHDNVVLWQQLLAFGENCYFRGDFPAGTWGRSMKIHFPGSGGIASVGYCSDATAQNAIGDLVWLDLNRNGLQDGYEWGVGGVTVTLHQQGSTGTSQRLGQQETDQYGKYYFGSLPDASYQVAFIVPSTVLPSDFSFTTEGESPNDENSDAGPVSYPSPSIRGVTDGISVSGGEEDLTWDAGLELDAAVDCVYTPAYLAAHPEIWPIDEIFIGQTSYDSSEISSYLSTTSTDETDQLKKYYFASLLSVSTGANDEEARTALDDSHDTLNGSPTPTPTPDLTNSLHDFTDGYYEYPDNCIDPFSFECDCARSFDTTCVDGIEVSITELTETEIVYSICADENNAACEATKDLSHFDFSLVQDPACVVMGESYTSLFGETCLSTYPVGSPPPPWSDCSSAQSCEIKPGGDPSCKDFDTGPVVKCNQELDIGKCRLAHLTFPESWEIGPTFFVSKDQNCIPGCILGPACQSCQTDYFLNCSHTDGIETTVARPSTLNFEGCDVTTTVETGDTSTDYYQVLIDNGGTKCASDLNKCGEFLVGCGSFGNDLRGIIFEQVITEWLMTVKVKCHCTEFESTDSQYDIDIDPTICPAFTPS